MSVNDEWTCFAVLFNVKVTVRSSADNGMMNQR